MSAPIATADTSGSSDRLSEFQALKSLVLKDLKTYEQLLKKNNIQEPYINKPEPHPQFDHLDFLPDWDLYHVQHELVAALGMLRNCVQSPIDRVLSMSYYSHYSSSLQFACRLNLTNVIDDIGKGQPVSIEQIAEKTSVHKDRIVKVLRILANLNIYNEVKENYFSNNRASYFLGSDIDIRALVETVGYFDRDAGIIPDTFIDPKFTGCFDPAQSSVMRAFKVDPSKYDSFFSYARDHHPLIIEAFARGMTGVGNATMPGILADYSWSKLAAGTTLVDVAGGRGSLLLPILRAHPHLKGVVQDREEVMPLARQYFESDLPQAIQQGRIEFDIIDLFESQPRSGDKHVYLLRWVVHDWPNALVIVALEKIKQKMKPDSRMLILDHLLQPAVTSEETTHTHSIKSKPWPLPQSGGIDAELSMMIDFQMMTGQNASERTASQVETLLQKVGLEIESIIQPRCSIGIITAKLAV